jgi:regulator of sirC expression with transglutaminase-like and TPR domain
LISEAAANIMSESFDFPELWSASDACAARRLEAAAHTGDLSDGLFAIEGADTDAITQGLTQLEAWGGDVWSYYTALRRADRPPTPATQLAALRAVLADAAGLRGDCEDYYHPRNSSLTHTLTQRRGLPILLSCVWIEVGKRADIAVEGVGLPGHFLVRIGHGPDAVLADPFDRGALRLPSCCANIVRCVSRDQLPWRDSFLDPVSPASIFERVLRNLICAHERRQDAPALYRYARLMAALCPQDIDAHLLFAHVAEAVGDAPAARLAYATICERFPNTDGAQVSTQRLDLLDKRHRCLN